MKKVTQLLSATSSLRLALALAMAALLTACAGGGGGYTMHLDAYAKHVEYGKSFFIVPGVMDAKATDAKFVSAANVLERALTAKGYVKAPDIDHADLGIYLAWHVVEEPHSPFDKFQENSHSLFPNPRRMLFMEYTRDVVIEAVDLARFKANDPQYMVWKIHVVSKGPDNDMGKAMPYVAAAVAQYAGTSGESYVTVDENFQVHPFKPAEHRHHERL